MNHSKLAFFALISTFCSQAPIKPAVSTVRSPHVITTNAWDKDQTLDTQHSPKEAILSMIITAHEYTKFIQKLTASDFPKIPVIHLIIASYLYNKISDKVALSYSLPLDPLVDEIHSSLSRLEATRPIRSLFLQNIFLALRHPHEHYDLILALARKINAIDSIDMLNTLIEALKTENIDINLGLRPLFDAINQYDYQAVYNLRSLVHNYPYSGRNLYEILPKHPHRKLLDEAGCRIYSPLFVAQQRARRAQDAADSIAVALVRIINILTMPTLELASPRPATPGTPRRQSSSPIHTGPGTPAPQDARPITAPAPSPEPTARHIRPVSPDVISAPNPEAPKHEQTPITSQIPIKRANSGS